jgi:hypothetical protein
MRNKVLDFIAPLIDRASQSVRRNLYFRVLGNLVGGWTVNTLSIWNSEESGELERELFDTGPVACSRQEREEETELAPGLRESSAKLE